MTTTFLELADATGVAQPIAVEQNVGTGVFTPHSVIETAGAPVGPTNPLISQPYQGSGTVLIGSQAAAGTDATLFAADTGTRIRYIIQNTDAANDVWCKWGSASSVGGAGCFLLAHGQTIDRYGWGINQSALHIIAAAGTPNVYFEKYS